MRGRQRGIELHRGAQAFDGGFEFALLAQEHAEVVLRHGVPGRDAHAGGEGAARAGRVAQGGERLPARAQGLGCVRRQRQRLVGRFQRAFRVAGPLARDGQVQPALGVARPGLHGGLEHGDGAAAVAGVQQRGPEQVGDLGGLGVARERALQRRHRVGDAPELAQGAAEIGLGVDERRLRLDGEFELFARLLQPLRAQQRRAEVVQRGGIPGLDLQRLGDQFLRCPQVAALQRDHAQQVRGVELARCLQQDLAVRRRGLVEAAALVLGHGLVQQRSGGGRFLGRAWRRGHQTSRCELAAATTVASA